MSFSGAPDGSKHSDFPALLKRKTPRQADMQRPQLMQFSWSTTGFLFILGSLLTAIYCTSFRKDVNHAEKPMIFETLEVGPLGVNCFILGCAASRDGVVIDPGGDVGRISEIVQRHGLKIRYIINTHGHFDHVGGNLQAVKAFGAPLLIHENDAVMLGRAAEVARMYGMPGENSPAPDSFLVEGMEIVFGTHRMKVLHTPGHTQGGCCLYLESEKKVITGDTLFADSIGRTDLPGGSHEQLIASIKSKLFTLPDEVTAYPGHGPKTTIGHEKHNNPYF
jgi:glyoxylase-like metal-dependent hydrolase (beta-lactamase superfamily II)